MAPGINRKHKAGNPLDEFKRAFGAGGEQMILGQKARVDMEENGLHRDQLADYVAALAARDLIDSRTHGSDHRVWIDAYKFQHNDVEWYMKFHPKLDGRPGYFIQKCHPSRGLED